MAIVCVAFVLGFALGASVMHTLNFLLNERRDER